MNYSKLNDSLQLAASIGVIIGLAMVAYEIRVSNRLGFEQANSDRMERWTALSEVALTTDASDLSVRALEGEPLTRAETRKLEHFESILLNTLFYDWTLAQTGTVTFPGGFELFYRGVIQGYLGSDSSRRRWEKVRIYWRPQFASAIDSALAAPEPRELLGEIDYIRNETIPTE